MPTVRNRCNISLKEAVLPERNDAETMYTSNLLHALDYYKKYNERLDLILIFRNLYL